MQYPDPTADRVTPEPSDAVDELLTPGEVRDLFLSTFKISQRTYYRCYFHLVRDAFRYYGAVRRGGRLRSAVKRAPRRRVLEIIAFCKDMSKAA